MIIDDQTLLGLAEQLILHKTVDIYVESSNTMHGKRLPETLLSNSRSTNDSYNSSEDSNDDEEVLVDALFIKIKSEIDEEICQARDSLRKYVDLKKSMINMGMEGGNEGGEIGQPRNDVEGDDENTATNRRVIVAETDKVTGYNCDCIDSSDPWSYEDTNEVSSANDDKRDRSRKDYYDPNVPLKKFSLVYSFKF